VSTPGTWSIDLTKWAEKAKGNMKVVIQKVALDAFCRVILRTPVDTGRARANWGVAIGTAAVTSPNVAYVDKEGTTAIGAAAAKVFDWNAQGSIFLCNNLPYIGALEYGHSKQAPGGMVRVTMAEFDVIVKSAASGGK